MATGMNDIGKSGKGKAGGEDAATEMMALLEAELKTVHDVMGKKWRCAVVFTTMLSSADPRA